MSTRRGDAAGDPFASIRSIDGPDLVDVPAFETEENPGGPPRVTVLLPTLLMHKMTGGTNTALNLTVRLAAHGYAVRFVSPFGHVDEDLGPVRQHVAGLLGDALPDGVEFATASRQVPLAVRPDDVFVATWWPTAHVAQAALPLTRQRAFIYLVQDFEPGFYPWSTDYALALSSYDFPSRVVFNESLVADHFRESRVGVFADPGREGRWTSFEPAVDRGLFKREPALGGRARRRLVYYARPNRTRNCFELGLRAIRLAAQAGTFDPAGWEIVSLAGRIPALELAPGLTMHPAPWMSYADYARYLGESDVLLSLMLSPHTSYPPLEMATAGGVVVTNTFGVKTEAALRAISPRILASPPDAAALASALGRAAAFVADGVADGSAEGAAGGTAGGASPPDVALPATWDDSFAAVIPWLIETIGELVDER